MAIRMAQIQANEAPYLLDLARQAQSNLAPSSRIVHLVVDRAYVDGKTLYALDQMGIRFVLLAKTNLAAYITALAKSIEPPCPMSAVKRSHTVMVVTKFAISPFLAASHRTFMLYHLFTDPLWISAHNFFHAPLVLLGIGLAGYVGVRQEKKWGTVLVWFALGAGLHSLIDVFTHAGDGPLLLFPINWHIRFNSPVSYWDPRHFGLIFAPLEHLLDLVILFYWAHTWRRQHKAKTAGPEVQG